MLTLDETVFVEHKVGIGEQDSFKLVQAVAAFANTAGGWVLLGVENGKIIANGDSLWAARTPSLWSTWCETGCGA